MLKKLIYYHTVRHCYQHLHALLTFYNTINLFHAEPDYQQFVNKVLALLPQGEISPTVQ
jgi:hypothetical protein